MWRLFAYTCTVLGDQPRLSASVLKTDLGFRERGPCSPGKVGECISIVWQLHEGRVLLRMRTEGERGKREEGRGKREEGRG
jgi:hypothetical protein